MRLAAFGEGDGGGRRKGDGAVVIGKCAGVGIAGSRPRAGPRDRGGRPRARRPRGFRRRSAGCKLREPGHGVRSTPAPARSTPARRLMAVRATARSRNGRLDASPQPGRRAGQRDRHLRRLAPSSSRPMPGRGRQGRVATGRNAQAFSLRRSMSTRCLKPAFAASALFPAGNRRSCRSRSMRARLSRPDAAPAPPAS